MMFKLFTRCAGCRKKRLYVARRSVILPSPINQKATSKEFFCGRCFTKQGKHALQNPN